MLGKTFRITERVRLEFREGIQLIQYAAARRRPGPVSDRRGSAPLPSASKPLVISSFEPNSAPGRPH